MIYLNPIKQARLKVKLLTRKGWKVVDCLIDTGFSGGVSLPLAFITQIKGKPRWRQAFELADGSIVEYDLYKISILYNKREKLLSGIFSKSDEALVGLEFLDGFRFILDLKKYQVSLK